MREAVGGSILFYIILGFIGVFIVFIAIIMNYASAYRTNNYVLNMIEQTEGRKSFGTESDDTSQDTLVGYLKRNNYYNGLNVSCTDNDNGAVFHVKTYINIYIPLIMSEGQGFKVPINNDTKTIYGVSCNDNSIASKGDW